jgi:hypothetical protein
MSPLSLYFLLYLHYTPDILRANGIVPAPVPVLSGQKRKADDQGTAPIVRVKREKIALTSVPPETDPKTEEIRLIQVSLQHPFLSE